MDGRETGREEERIAEQVGQLDGFPGLVFEREALDVGDVEVGVRRETESIDVAVG